jgi:hypothetical protein
MRKVDASAGSPCKCLLGLGFVGSRGRSWQDRFVSARLVHHRAGGRVDAGFAGWDGFVLLGESQRLRDSVVAASCWPGEGGEDSWRSPWARLGRLPVGRLSQRSERAEMS